MGRVEAGWQHPPCANCVPQCSELAFELPSSARSQAFSGSLEMDFWSCSRVENVSLIVAIL